MINFKSVLITTLLVSVAPKTALPQNQSKILNDFAVKFNNYTTEYANKSTTLQQYGKLEEANTLSELGNIAYQYALRFEHLADLVEIFYMSNEQLVKHFIRKRVAEKTSVSKKRLNEATIEYLNAIIDGMAVESIKEKTIQFRTDLIAAEAILDTL